MPPPIPLWMVQLAATLVVVVILVLSREGGTAVRIGTLGLGVTAVISLSQALLGMVFSQAGHSEVGTYLIASALAFGLLAAAGAFRARP